MCWKEWRSNPAIQSGGELRGSVAIDQRQIAVPPIETRADSFTAIVPLASAAQP
jgi:hypothetical protein